MEKIRFTDRIKSLAKRIIDVFREYPVTMICIMLAALVGTILIPIHDRDLEQNFERVIFFFLLTAMQAIAYEEIVPQKKPIRITGYIVSVLLSILNVYVLSYDRETFLGIDNNIVCEIFAKTLLVYGVIMIGLSIHHMFRRTEEDFEIYAKSVFDPARLGIFIGTDVTSKYSERSSSQYYNIAAYIDSVAEAERYER